MKKKLSPRTPPISNKWQRLVFGRANVKQTKKNKEYLLKLYIQGYSHKSAAIKLTKFGSGGDD